MQLFALQVLHTNPRCDISIANYDWNFFFAVSKFTKFKNFFYLIFIEIDLNFPKIFYPIENNSLFQRQLHLLSQ